MNDEERELLARAVKISEDNHRILKKMERSVYWSRVWTVARLFLILAPIVLGYIYLRPFFERFNGIYSDLENFSNSSSTSSFLNSTWVKSFLEQLKIR